MYEPTPLQTLTFPSRQLDDPIVIVILTAGIPGCVAKFSAGDGSPMVRDVKERLGVPPVREYIEHPPGDPGHLKRMRTKLRLLLHLFRLDGHAV
jgi:hypothetical protein